MDAKTNGAMPVSRVPDVIDHERNFYQYGTDGLTKREMFAAMVMAGLAANPGGPWQSNAQNGWGLVNCLMEDVAFTATTAADALLAELAKGGAA